MLKIAPRRALAAGLLAACATMVAAGPAHAAPSGSGSGSTPPARPGPTAPAPAGAASFGIGPASARSLDTRPTLSYNATPGAELTDHVGIVNLGRTPLTLSLYAVDAVNSSTGAVSYRPRANPGTDARRWITIDPRRHRTSILVKARSTVIVPITVAVPANATPGDHTAGIVASLLAAARNTSGQKVSLEQRVALRTTFHVTGPIRPHLVVSNLTAHYGGTADPVGSGTATVTYTVHNTGNVALAAAQRVGLDGLFGTGHAVRAAATIPTLLPGNSVTETVRFADVYPTVHLTARVRLTPTAQAGTAIPPVAPVTASTGFWAVPWALIVALAVLAGLVTALIVWRARHPRTVSRHHRVRGTRRAPAAGEA